MNIIFLAAHIDDEITSSGTLLKFKEQGHNILYVALSNCGRNELIEECKFATNKFAYDRRFYGFEFREFYGNRQSILDELIKLNELINPDLVLCPSSESGHQDHEVLHNESKRAFKNSTIYGWEMIWNMTNQNLTIGSEITESQLNSKIQYLKHYSSQQHREYFNSEFIRSLAIVRGIQFKFKYAESFEAIRIRL